MWLVIFLVYFSSKYGSLWKMRGYPIYKDVWDAVIGEELWCEREPDTNGSDQYAATVKRWDNHWSSAM